MRQRFENYVFEGSEYAHWTGLYISFHLNWVLGPFVHGRLQILQTSEVTFAHVIAPLTDWLVSALAGWIAVMCVYLLLISIPRTTSNV